jgi:magnesium-transporting ATPase (P-type)
MSQIETKVNYILGFILLVQVILSVICGILAGVFNNNNNNPASNYIAFGYSAAVDGILSFFSYIVLINTMIPISLIVSI